MGLSSLQLWGCEPQMWVIGSSIKSVTNQWCKWCIFCPLIWYQSLLTKVVLVPFENSFEQRSFLWFCICFSPVFYICICICVQHWSCVIGGHWAGIGEPEMGSLLQTSIIVAKNLQSVYMWEIITLELQHYLSAWGAVDTKQSAHSRKSWYTIIL